MCFRSAVTCRLSRRAVEFVRCGVSGAIQFRLGTLRLFCNTGGTIIAPVPATPRPSLTLRLLLWLRLGVLGILSAGRTLLVAHLFAGLLLGILRCVCDHLRLRRSDDAQIVLSMLVVALRRDAISGGMRISGEREIFVSYM